MLKLVSTSDLMLSRVRYLLARAKSVINLKLILLLSLCIGSVAHAQNVNIPTVEVAGIDDDTDGANIAIILLKYIAKIVIWAIMGIAGFIALKTINKSWNEQKSNDQGRWGAVVGDSLGSVVMVILVISVGTWVLKFFS